MKFVPENNNNEHVRLPDTQTVSGTQEMSNPDDINTLETLISINQNLRTNIRLSLSIYKKLNNFDHKYIHELLDGQKRKNSE